jgi:hypothetical protein
MPRTGRGPADRRAPRALDLAQASPPVPRARLEEWLRWHRVAIRPGWSKRKAATPPAVERLGETHPACH